MRNRFKELDIVLLRGDWTAMNPEITNALQKYGRSGVPLNVYYPSGKRDSPVVFPSVLTPSIVLGALEAVNK